MDRRAEHRLRDVKSIGCQKNVPMLRGVACSKKVRTCSHLNVIEFN